MVAGRLDQRVTLWERQDNGGDGFARPVYVKTGTWWGRVDAVTDRQRVPQAPQSTVDYATDARMTVADYVPVPRSGCVTVEGNTALFWIRGVQERRQLREQRVDLQCVHPDEYVEFIGFDQLPVGDGYHLVSTSAFSSAFDLSFA